MAFSCVGENQILIFIGTKHINFAAQVMPLEKKSAAKMKTLCLLVISGTFHLARHLNHQI